MDLRIGEGLDQHDPVAPGHLPVRCQSPQRCTENRRGSVRLAAGRQNAEPLVVGDIPQLPVADGRRPADEVVTSRTWECRRSVADEANPLAVDHSYMTQGLADEPTAQPVVFVEQRVEPADLGGDHGPDDESLGCLEELRHGGTAITAVG